MGTKRPHCRRDWDRDLREVGARLGFEVLEWEGYPAKRNKVLIRCKHKEQWVFPQGQLGKTHCCKVASKLASNNPAHGKPSWNADTKGVSTGHGFGGKPRGEAALEPGTLYVVRYNDGEEHIKVGITGKTVQERLGHRLVEVITTYQSTLGKCFEMEQRLLKELDEFRYSSETTTELLRPEALEAAIRYLSAPPNK